MLAFRGEDLPRIVWNDNDRPAGSLDAGVLTLRMEVVRAEWQFLGDDRPGVELEAPGRGTDPPEADHAESLAGDLHPAPARALPAARLQCRMRLRDVPCEREDQPELRELRGLQVERAEVDPAPRLVALDADERQQQEQRDARAVDHVRVPAQPVGAQEQPDADHRRGQQDLEHVVLEVDAASVEPLLGLCDVILGVYASPLTQFAAKDLRSSLAVSQRAFEIGMFQFSRRKFHQVELLIAPPALSHYALFDIRRHREIVEVGHAATLERLEEIRALLDRRR